MRSAIKFNLEYTINSVQVLRNILVHDYLDGINLETVWEVVENYLPDLEKAIKDFIE